MTRRQKKPRSAPISRADAYDRAEKAREAIEAEQEGKNAIRLALNVLEEIREERWSIRPECGNDKNCGSCIAKKAARERAEMAIGLLKTQLENT